MLRMPAVWLAGFALPALLAFAAGASPIVGVSQTRSVTASATDYLGFTVTDSESAPDFAPFDAVAAANSGTFPNSFASASQDSSIGAFAITGTLSANGASSTIGGAATATALFDVVFEVTETVPFELTASAFSTLPYELSSFVFSGPGGTIAEAGIFPQLPAIDLTGELTPGEYHIVAEASIEDIEAFFKQATPVQFTLTIVPEPASVALLASGLLALAAARRRDSTLE